MINLILIKMRRMMMKIRSPRNPGFIIQKTENGK